MAAAWKTMGALGIALGLSACSSGRMVQVPPRVDLSELGTVGLIDFRSPQGSNDLSRQANRQFLTEIQSAQPGVAVLELGDEARVLQGVGAESLDPETMRAIGEKHRVDVILFGVLEAKEVRPKLSIGGGLESLNAKAEVEGSLVAKMYDTRTGATLWTCSRNDTRAIAALSVSGGGLSGGGTTDPAAARGELFQALVARATEDFRPTWTRVRE